MMDVEITITISEHRKKLKDLKRQMVLYYLRKTEGVGQTKWTISKGTGLMPERVSKILHKLKAEGLAHYKRYYNRPGGEWYGVNLYRQDKVMENGEM